MARWEDDEDKGAASQPYQSGVGPYDAIRPDVKIGAVANQGTGNYLGEIMDELRAKSEIATQNPPIDNVIGPPSTLGDVAQYQPAQQQVDPSALIANSIPQLDAAADAAKQGDLDPQLQAMLEEQAKNGGGQSSAEGGNGMSSGSGGSGGGGGGGSGCGSGGCGSGGGGGGGKGGMMGKAVCTVAYLHGYINRDLILSDYRAAKLYDADTMRGYFSWGYPVAKFGLRHPKIFSLFAWLPKAWAEQMAYKEGLYSKSNLLGRCLEWAGVPICRLIGRVIRKMEQ